MRSSSAGSDGKEKKSGVFSLPHDSLRRSPLVNYYKFYFRLGDWGRGSFLSHSGQILDNNFGHFAKTWPC